MAATVTVTGTMGPAVALTSAVFTDVLSFTINTENNILTLRTADRVIDISINAATTITATKSGSTYTLVVS